MKKAFPILALLLLSISCSKDANDGKSDSPGAVTENSHEYFVGLIRMGSAWTAEVTPETEKLQERHMANINRLAESGELVLAGPTWIDSVESPLRGLFFFDTETEQDARSLTRTDPAVQAKRLAVDVFPWKSRKPIKYREPVEMTTYQMVLFLRGVNWSEVTEPDFDSLALWQFTELQKYDPAVAEVLAGWFGKSVYAQTPSSMFIYRLDSLSWLQSVCDSSLPVQRGIIEPKLFHWYGPSGLGE